MTSSHACSTRPRTVALLPRFAAFVVASAFASACIAQEDRSVYADALGAGFEDFSWAQIDLDNTTPVHGGTRSIEFGVTNWEGVYVHATSVLDTQDFHGLRLFVHGGATGAQQLRVSLQLGTTVLAARDLDELVTGGAVAADAWREVWWPFSGEGAPAGSFDGIIVQADAQDDQGTVYLDDIVLPGRTAPPPAAVTVSVDPAAARRAIDPNIYGVSFGADAQHADLRYPIRRWGGNTTSRYNFQFDVDNRGRDYFFQHIASGDGSNLPDNSTANQFIDATAASGGETLLTIPTLGWVGKDAREKDWSFSIAQYGAQTVNECSFYGPNPPFWCSIDSGNGICTGGPNCGPANGDGIRFIVGNDPLDTSKPAPPAYATAWVTHLRTRHGAANDGGVKHFALDNEPMLWNSTHRDVHPTAATFDEVWQSGRDRAIAIKTLEPDAVVFGPVTWGWCDFWTSAADAQAGDCFEGPDRTAHGGLAFVEWYLQQVCATPGPNGARLVDVLDLHYYPQGGVDGLEVEPDDDGDAAVQARRLRSLRELYDPTWTAESWIGETAYPITNLLPRARAAIDTYCPGTQLALTEYKWGPDDGLTGALAQAEALAIFGREGVDYAMRWIAPDVGSLAEDAFRMYLDYDGANARVVGDSVAAATDAPQVVNAYAVDQADGVTFVLLFNHGTQARAVTVNVAQTPLSAWRRYRLDGNGFAAIGGSLPLAGSSVVLASMPGRSAELLVLTKGVVVDPEDQVFDDGFEGG